MSTIHRKETVGPGQMGEQEEAPVDHGKHRIVSAHERAAAMAIARACVGQPGGAVVTLNRVSHCGIVWSSNPTIIATEPAPGWTRTGRCGKCDVDLVPFDEAP
jgi:hypothetical protein